MLFSELYNKKVVSLSNTADLGSVENLLFNENLTDALFLKTSNALISIKEVYKITDAVVIKSAEEGNKGEALSLYGLPLFSTTGKFLGNCQDILLTKNFRVRNIITAEKSYTPRAVFSVGESILIKTSLPKKAAVVYTAKIKGREIIYGGDFTFLIGKKLSSALFDRQGRLLAPKGGKISDTLLKKAKILGKLKELAVKAREG